MRLSRCILSALLACAVALAPGVNAVAAVAAQAETHAQSTKSAVKGCHGTASKSAEAPAPKTSSHCPQCGGDAGCGAACLAKCFQMSATLALEPAMIGLPIPSPLPPLAEEPAAWSAKPPAPPPRA